MRAVGVASSSSRGAGAPLEFSASTPDLIALAHAAVRARPVARERLADAIALARALARTSQLGQAAQVIRLLGATDEQGQAWLSLVRQIAADGDDEAARALADAIGSRPWHAKAVGVLAESRARIGEYEAARSLAMSIPYPHDRLRTWASLAEASAVSGNPTWTAEFLDWAEQTETLDDWTVPTLPILIRAAEAAGDHSRALVFLARLESAARREHADREALRAGRTSRLQEGALSDTPALLPLLQAVISVGEYERAEVLLAKVRGWTGRAKARSAVAGALAQCGKAGRAERLACSIKDPGHRASALAALADAAAIAGNAARVTAVGKLVAASGELVNAGPVIAVGEAWAALGAADRAEAWVRSIAMPALRVEAQAAIAEALAIAGDLGRAETLALDIGDLQLRGEALYRLVTVLAEAGLLARAEAVAGSIPEASTRVRALAVIAAHAEKEAEARRLVGPALEVGDWPAVIEVLARVEPTAVTTIAEESLHHVADRQR
ncbi:hypothetical protein [Streptomyces sp. 2231.1]|uniref:hypothetical protein n=1 Tax=Streptomyces sp. 2231.1 TaxID=1855347 RepID=UPI00115FE27D|nr:hypothetical protein [Streptomyces sp. 2231.1]